MIIAMINIIRIWLYKRIAEKIHMPELPVHGPDLIMENRNTD